MLPEDAAYNIAFNLHIRSCIQVPVLRQTIAQLINLTRQVQTLPDREQAQLLLTKICHAVEQHQNGSISRKSDSAAPDSTYPRPLSARI